MKAIAGWLKPRAERLLRPSQVREERLMRRIYVQADRAMMAFLIGHLFLALLFAPVYDTWLVTFAVAIPSVAMFAVAAWLMPGQLLTRCVAGVSLVCFVALHIYQMHGLAEMHFFFFTAFTMMIAYQDFRALWPGALLIIAQHILFAALTNSGYQLSFFEQERIGVLKLVAHFGIALVHVTVCSLWAVQLRKKTLHGHAIHQRLATERRRIEEQLKWTRESEEALAEQKELLIIAQEALEQDLAAIARKEQEVRRSEERFNLAVEGAQSGIWDIAREDLEAGDDGYLYLSAQSYRLMGMEPRSEPVPMKDVVELVHPGDLERRAEQHRLIEAGGNNFDLEYRVRHPDGEYRWLHAKGRVVRDEEGNPIRMIGSLNDIHARKVAEELLAAARDEALRSAQAKADFLANMSHEIRTPMNGVLGLSALLLDSNLTDEQRDLASSIHLSGEALLTVLNDILDISKIEAGKFRIENEVFNLRTVLEDVSELFSAKAHEKGLELICLVPPDLPTGVVGDDARIRQVLCNLIGNAVKFTERGEVVLEARIQEADPENLWIDLEVRDTGIGIPADRLETIFESFTQADSSTTRKYGGTGLGLTISRQIVDLMGGKLSVQSKAGEGSAFSVRLRLARAHVEVEEPEGSLHGLRVLIVDDHPTNLRVLSGQLSAWGCRVQAVTSAAEALAELDRAPGDYDLVVLDQSMPEMDGIGLATQLREEPRFAPIPRLLLTSMGQTLSEIPDATSLFTVVLSKPVRSRALQSSLLKAMGRDATRRPAAIDRVAPDLSGVHILLAEDNPVNQKLASRLLEKCGCRYTLARDGVEAVDLFHTQQFDLVLMDCQMPNMDGYEATRRIRELERAGGRRVPILATTANAMEGDREKCLMAGMDDHLTKPLRIDVVMEKLEKWSRVAA